MEGSVTASTSLAVSDLVQMFEDAEEASYDARKEAERDRDYVDNKQWTSAEKAELAKRGQPATVINRIKGKIEFLVGMEIERRIDPKAFPRTPVHQDDADGASQALKYATDAERYDHKRTRAWRNMLVEGAAKHFRFFGNKPGRWSRPIAQMLFFQARQIGVRHAHDRAILVTSANRLTKHTLKDLS